MPHPWHVVRVRSGFERKALVGLSQFDAFSPLHRENVLAKALPIMTGYIFARWETVDPFAWHDVNDAKYVVGFIGSPWPVDVTDPVVDFWYESKDADGVVVMDERSTDILRGFKTGDLVKFTYGPFADQVGICIWVDRTGARVNTGLLGRESSVWVPLASVRKVDISSAGLGQPPMSSSKRRRERQKRLLSDVAA